MKSPRNYYKGVMWQTNGFRIQPGFLLRSDLKPGCWCEIHEIGNGRGRWQGYVSQPNPDYDGITSTFYTKTYNSISAAKSNTMKLLGEHGCLVAKEPQP